LSTETATDYGPSVEAAGASWLFVGGCQRSGTTAMGHLLNVDERIVVGQERFKFLRTPPSILRFAPQIFFNPVPQETNGMNLEMYDRLRRRWAAGGVRYLGDKNPSYVRGLETLEQTYPGCRLIMIVRDAIDVANSFHMRATNPRDHWPERNDHRVAVRLWNDSLRMIKAHVLRGRSALFVVEYEALFAGEEAHVDALYRFLELDVPDAMRERGAAMRDEWPQRRARPRALPADAAAEVEAGRDRDLEAWIRARIATQLEP
jgi:hypothetical protein